MIKITYTFLKYLRDELWIWGILIIFVLIYTTCFIMSNYYNFVDTKLFKNSWWEIVSFIAILTWFLFSTITLVISLNLQKETLGKWIQLTNITTMKRQRWKIINSILFQTILSIITCSGCIILKNVDNWFYVYAYWLVIYLIFMEIFFIVLLLLHFSEYIKEYFIFWKEQ